MLTKYGRPWWITFTSILKNKLLIIPIILLLYSNLYSLSMMSTLVVSLGLFSGLLAGIYYKWHSKIYISITRFSFALLAWILMIRLSGFSIIVTRPCSLFQPFWHWVRFCPLPTSLSSGKKNGAPTSIIQENMLTWSPLLTMRSSILDFCYNALWISCKTPL